MTRFMTFCGLVLLAAGPTAADDKKDVPKDLAPFQGTWKPIKATKDGESAPTDELAKMRMKIVGDKVIVSVDNKEIDTGTISVSTKKEPNEIDVMNSKGEKMLGIYKFDKDGKCTMCAAEGKDAVRPKSFDAKGVMVMVLEKVKD